MSKYLNKYLKYKKKYLNLTGGGAGQDTEVMSKIAEIDKHIKEKHHVIDLSLISDQINKIVEFIDMQMQIKDGEQKHVIDMEKKQIKDEEPKHQYNKSLFRSNTFNVSSPVHPLNKQPPSYSNASSPVHPLNKQPNSLSAYDLSSQVPTSKKQPPDSLSAYDLSKRTG